MPKGKNSKSSAKAKPTARALKDGEVDKVQGGGSKVFFKYDAAGKK